MRARLLAGVAAHTMVDAVSLSLSSTLSSLAYYLQIMLTQADMLTARFPFCTMCAADRKWQVRAKSSCSMAHSDVCGRCECGV